MGAAVLAPSQLEIRPADGRAPFAWRAFGAAEDLAVDFAGDDRPGLVTTILHGCRLAPGAAGADDVWALSLAGRIGGLLAIHARTQAAEALPIEMRCPTQGCAEPLEAELPLADLLALAQQAELEPTLGVAGLARRCVVRRPCGRDQRRWRAATAGAEDDMAGLRALVLDSLLVEGRPKDEAERLAVAEALEAFDPLAAFQVAIACPACGTESDIPVDLEDLLLQELARAQGRLLLDVHRLAGRYGWSEAEVLAVPPARRRHYLALIAAEAEP